MIPMRSCYCFALLTAIVFAASSARQVDAKPPVVAGFERFYSSDKSDDTAAGQLLVGELNCLSCHKAAAQNQYSTKIAPDLTNVGERIQLKYLRKFIAAPHQVKPGTTMPDLFAGTAPAKRKQQVEALAQFLATTGTLRETPPSPQSVQKGQVQFHQVGCVACHNPKTKGAKPIAGSIPLVGLDQKYSIPSLTSFLGNPLRVRPSGRMPHLNLNQGEATDIASYLLRDVKVPHKLKFKYYEGNWKRIPDFSKMKPRLSGGASSFSVQVGPRRDNFGIRFEGFIQIPRDGSYRFRLGSDDGSRLSINGKRIVDVDGVHPVVYKEQSAQLKKGPHSFVIDFFEAGGGEELFVQFSGPGIRRQSLLPFVTSERKPPVKKGVAKLQTQVAASGKKLFSSLGCASCHQLRGKGKLAATAMAKPWQSLSPSEGCLDSKSKTTPRFNLSPRQSRAIRSALGKKTGPLAKNLKSGDRIQHTLVRMNCYACHERDKIGGVDKSRQKYFLSNQPEMGEEGRIPPTLTGVGAKLKLVWLKRLFNQGAKDRPYMLTRMPRFGLTNVGGLPDLVNQADKLDLKKVVKTKEKNSRLRGIGRKLAGAKGLSCIKCHSFRNIRATGIQATSLTRMADRLDEKWFHHYMKSPKRFRPTTRMPAPWPNGVAFFPKLLNGNVDDQIHAVWTFLRSGNRAAIPFGLSTNSMELMAISEPIMYRNFIAGAGPRAIGVGYPERANLAFDANEMHIAMVWQGSFIDASRHWRGRGVGFQGPLGENILRIPFGAGFAVLESQTTKWPTEKAKKRGYRFGGYLLNKKRQPTFLYTYKNVSIKDFPVPVESDDFPTFRREFQLQSNGDSLANLIYRAAVAKSIKSLGKGWFEIDGKWKTRLSLPGAYIRKSGQQQELLMSIEFKKNKAKFVQEYDW